MKQPLLHNFIVNYFNANDCQVLEQSHAHVTIQLTPEMDKLIMNRPFYWHYLEKTGGVPNPMSITFITNHNQISEDFKGEIIHFGAPRLHQLFRTTRELGGYIRIYEQLQVTSQNLHPLQPWLGLNIKVSFCSDRKKEILLSLGLNLINGQIVPQFMEKLHTLTLTPKLPDMCFTMTPIITLSSGIKRLNKIVETFVENEDTSWAEEAQARWQEELALLESFYEDLEEKPESYFVEKQALKELYSPSIHIEIINGGMFYLKQNQYQS
ncbi:YqhG family protein [Alkalihalobacillus trypoxylicola]|uniref:YqhG n=1 Tax=Alkalihalobacillus trypoxylicola TaxID=519424 RepID=A0A161PEJ6_9BACI|nr:YqhG family protein [Alkalihalobacillus trypoxylicola]KYG30979.1 hypothetical protein AZF04_18455 [Alkalihalobacillus trypoxylicola]